MSKKTLITGALILTAANLITRFMGFFYRIYMANTIGTEGMGLYQLIMPIYMLTWSITSSGFTTTISKLTAQEKGHFEYGNMGRILKQSIALCFCLSICVSLILYLKADFIAVHIIQESRTAMSLKILSLAIPFMSAGSCIRGYFFGLQNTLVPALSQIVEQLMRMLGVFLLSAYFVPKGLDYACAAAVIGIVLGEIISFLFVFVGYIRFKKKKCYTKKPVLSSVSALSMILSMALPLTASRLTGSLLSTSENIMIPQRLMLYGQSVSESMSTYGKLTGMAMPLLMLPSALLMAVSVSLVPEISEAMAVKQTEKISRTVCATLLFTGIVGIGASTMFAIFPREICYIVYSNGELGSILFSLSFLCPFVYLQMTLSGLLNGLGEHLFIFAINIISSIINIGFIYFLIPIMGVNGFILGWFVSLLATTFLSLKKIIIRANVKIEYFNCFIKPLMSGLLAGLIIRYLIQISTPSKMFFLLSLILMFLLYIVFLLVLGCLSRDNFSSVFAYKRKKN